MRRLSRRRTARHEAGAYLIDGPTLLDEAIRDGVEIDRVYVETDSLGLAVLDSVPRDVTIREVRTGVLARVLDVVTPHGVVSVARIGSCSADGVITSASSRGLPLVVLVDVADPGNVGTMIRTAEAAGCVGMVVTGDSADPYSPKAVRASAGSIFRLPVAMAGDVGSTLEGIHQHRIMTLAAVTEGTTAPEEMDLTAAFALVMGNEAHGLPVEIVETCTGVVSVPMAGSVESLNVAMAAAVLLFEAARQRRVGGIDPTV